MKPHRPRIGRGLLVACSALLFAAAAFPADVAQGGHQHGASGEKSFAALIDEAMNVMQMGMSRAPMNGDADHDFAAMMIPHHQGAIDMAKLELIYGHDPVLRRLAQAIVVEQQQEIDLMRRSLDK